MHRMNVIALVSHSQPIAFALVNGKHRLHFLHRERRAIDRPKVKAVVGGIVAMILLDGLFAVVLFIIGL